MIYSIPQLVRRAIRRRSQIRAASTSPVRHRLLAESLESRVLLAADISPLQNPFNRYDTNLDGRVNSADVATVINYLVTNGPGTVARAAGVVEGESANSAVPKLVDVNGDGAISNTDVTAVIRRLVEGEPDPRARFYIQLFDADTNEPITDINGTPLPGQSVSVGQNIYARISVQDLDTVLSRRVVRVERPTSPSNNPRYNDGQRITITSDQGTRVFELEVPDASNFQAGVGSTNGVPNIAINFTHTEIPAGANEATRNQIVAEDSARLANLLATAINNENFGVTASVDEGDAEGGELRSLLKLQGETDVTLSSVRGFQLSSERGLTSAFLDLHYNENLAVVEDAFVLPNDPFAPPPNPTFFQPSPEYYALAWSTELGEEYPLVDLANRVISDVGGLASTSASYLAVRLDDPVGDAVFLVTTVAFTVESGDIDAVNDDFTSTPISTGATNVELDVLSNDTLPIINIEGGFSDGAIPTAVYTPYSGQAPALTAEQIVFPSTSVPVGGSSLEFVLVGISQGPLSQATIDQRGTPDDITDDVILFTPAAGVEGNVEIRYRLTDTSTGGLSDEATVTVTVASQNDPPVNTIPTEPISTPEGTDYAFSTSATNRLAVSDADAGDEIISTRLQVTGGTLHLVNTSGVTVTGNNSADLLIEGSQSAINAVLDNGNLIYRPVAEVPSDTTVTFTMTTSDHGHTGGSTALTDVDQFTITVLAVNDPPVNTVPGPQSVEGNEGEANPPTLVFSSGNGNAISVADVDHTNLTVQLSVTRASGSGAAGTLTLGSTPDGVTVTGNNSDTITISGPQVALNAALNGLVYTPPANFDGDVNLTVHTTDGANGVDEDVVSITVEAQNVLRARPDTLTTSEETSVQITPDDVLENDSPSPGATLTFGSFNSPAKGTLTETSPGVWTYTPPDHYFGQDTFTYTVSDTNGNTATGTVVVTVTEVNDPPVANDDSGGSALRTLEDTPLNIPFSALLGNDTVSSPSDPFEANPDPSSGLDAQSLTITSVSVVGGTATADVQLDAANSQVVVTPTGDSNGTVIFTYTVRDNGTTNGADDFLTATATVTVLVVEQNDAPTAQNKSFTTPEDTNLDIPVADLLSGATPGGGADEANQTLSVISVTQPASGGTVSLSGGVVTFDPADDFNGTVTFTYVVQDNGTTDGSADPRTATATVTVTVTPVNDAPVVVGSPSATAIADQTVTFDASLLLGSNIVLPGPANESGQTLRITNAVLVTPSDPGNSTLQVVNNGTGIEFRPPSGFAGQATIRYTVQDNGQTNGVDDFKSVEVTLTVDVLNFKPTSVSGRVYWDANLDGDYQVGERGIGNVELRITGTNSVSGQAVNLPPVYTAPDGTYSFTNLAPGTYTVSVMAPHMLLDGSDDLGSELLALNGQESAHLGVNSYTFTVTVNGTVARTDNDFGGNNFSFRGIDPAYFSLIDRRAGLPRDGLLVACSDDGQSYWYMLLGDGWHGTTGVEASLGSNGLLDLTIHWNGGQRTKTMTLDYRTLRLMGDDGNGNHLLRLEGDASYFFGEDVFSNPDAEGEPLASAAAGDYEQGVDHLMESEDWLA